jgi:carbamoyl-phosphate synthase large subunit
MTRDEIQTVLVIGSGPIIIGQAAEFDYAGAQACRALREEGKRVILVNSNPATIMTDEGVADVTYIEPLTVASVRRIIARERPDGLLATLGGQTGLNLAVALAKDGALDEYNVKLLGTPLKTIEQAEDRELFKQLLISLGLDVPPSKTVTTVEGALTFSDDAIGLPAVIRPAFTLGGSGGGIARTRAELATIAQRGIDLSPIHQILVEQYLGGWKEIEYEVIRDSAGACVTVCNMENFDPLGIHTGDSIVVAPSQTLSDREYQMLRTASLRIISALGVEGGCNIQFALDPNSFKYYVIEVNPRVSRSSALASKATGYPIARVATKIAVGKRLDEIANEITGKTVAAFEPALDYCVVKIPRWPFDKFPLADRLLGTQMKATGEVMAIDRTFEAALQKAMRALEVRSDTLNTAPSEYDDLGEFPPNDVRLWRLLDSLRVDTADGAIETLHARTGIDVWFLAKLRRIIKMEQRLARQELTSQLLREAKRMGFSDQQIASAQAQRQSATTITARTVYELRREWGIVPTFKMVDTCAAEFAARTPYFYATYEQENEAPALAGAKAVVLGSGPIRIGQGIEFDYCSVRASQALRDSGARSVMINSNPETVSTDFDMSDRLYFEPLDAESVIAILDNEAGEGEKPPVMTQFGGQTAIGLAAPLDAAGTPILGTSVDSIDLAEDRRRFDELMERLGVPRPRGAAVTSIVEAERVAEEIGFPVLVRPSYVLGGRAMEIIRSQEALTRYATRVFLQFGDRPILIDRYLTGREIEVDAISDGESALIPGVMEHIERAGVHSGDSFAVYPTRSLSQDEIRAVARHTTEIARALHVQGLINAQFVVTEPEPDAEPGANVWILEVNPRASRTVPFLSKVTGVPMVTLATRAALGEKLAAMDGGKWVGHPDNLWPVQPLFAVKGPVFSMSKLVGAELALGPEMKSTGEVMGIDKTYPAALRKALIAANVTAPDHNGAAFVSIADRDKAEAMPILQALGSVGYTFYATAGTAKYLTDAGLTAQAVARISEEDETILHLIREHAVQLVINTITGGGTKSRAGIEILDGFKIRRAAVEANTPCLTSLDTAHALVEAMRAEDESLCLPFVAYRED